MNLLGAAMVNICVLVTLLDNGYNYDSFTFWAVMMLSNVYVSTKIE